jgi:hypothetical protein
MMTEQKRGCGYRKIGGLYLMGSNEGRPCGRFPFALTVCPVCSAGVKQQRGFAWIRPAELFRDLPVCKTGGAGCACPMQDITRLADDEGRAGLIWVGEGFYPTPADFQKEVSAQGVCRRIGAIPKGLVPGKTWVFLAHPKAVPVPVSELTVEERADLPEDTTHVYRPGVFSAFLVTAIEKCVTEQEAADEEAMAKLAARNITPAILPDVPRHRGSVYDNGDEEAVDAPELDLGHEHGAPDGATLN